MASVAIQPVDATRLGSAVLSVGMHLLLALVLVIGVNWQSRSPEAVSVELWRLPEPIVEAPPLELKPEPALAPRPAPPPPQKPDIVIEKEKKLPPKKEEPKKERPLDLDLGRQIKEQAQRELENVQREREKHEVLSQFKPVAPPASAGRIDARYADRVRDKIKPLIILPPDIAGNPEAIFDVEQLPTGEVIRVKLRTSSGNAAYDDAVDRAIRKASPLPRPDPPQTPPRMLVLRFRPVEL